LSASDSTLWIAIHNAGTVFALDPQTNRVTAQVGPKANRVCGLDASSPGALWLANCGPGGAAGGGIVRIDTQTKQVAATVAGANSFDVAAGEGGIWAADDDGNAVWRSIRQRIRSPRRCRSARSPSRSRWPTAASG